MGISEFNITSKQTFNDKALEIVLVFNTDPSRYIRDMGKLNVEVETGEEGRVIDIIFCLHLAATIDKKFYFTYMYFNEIARKRFPNNNAFVIK